MSIVLLNDGGAGVGGVGGGIGGNWGVVDL